jgi:hypothetical protein
MRTPRVVLFLTLTLLLVGLGCGGGSGTEECNACTLGQSLCDGNAVRTCIQDGECTRLSDAIPCDGDDVCSGGECTGECTDQCTVGDTQCSGDLEQVCEVQVSGCTDFSLPEACPGELTCTNGSCGGTCTDECPGDGDTRCAGDAVETCAEQTDGCLAWEAPVACPEELACTDGACVPCTDGTMRCSAAGNVEECTDGTWYQTQSCPFGCDAGACLTSITCTPGEHQCNGDAVEICNSSGTAFLYAHTCAVACSGGLCTGACTPGARRCNGDLVEECNGSGTAWATTETCTTFCDDASATCALTALDITVNTNLDGEIVVDGPVVIHSGATLSSPAGDLTIRATSITVELNGSITAAPTGQNPLGNGGAYTCCGCGGAGGGYGTAGSYNTSCGTTGVGPAFGSTTDATVAPGGKGGNSQGGTLGGNGGGVIRLIAGTIDVAGQITANGTNGAPGGSAGGGGGGSGGGILLAADSLTMSGVISAVGGSGGAGSPYGGAAGGNGRVKLLHGTAASVTGTISGTLTQGLLPPLTIASTTHPDPGLVYNDDFDLVGVTWDRAFPSVQGYYHRTTTSQFGPPTPGTGMFTASELMTIARSALVQGANYFHLVSVDPMSNVGLVEHQFRIQMNTVPPTITSSSHPSQTAWSTNPDAFFAWTLPNADANYQGYLYVLDHYGDTVPTPDDALLPVTQKQILLSGLTSGIWAFHVVSVDQRGYRTRIARHYIVRIGTDPGSGGLLGTVTDGGTPVMGATVRVNRGLVGPDQTTLANGTYNFGGTIPAGTWEVEVSKAGYATQTQSVVVNAAETTTANFALAP